MAIENKVLLNGQVVDSELFSTTRDGEDIVYKVVFTLLTLRSYKTDDGRRHFRKERIKVVLRDEKQIAALFRLPAEEGCFMEIYGLLCTVPKPKRFTCPSCGNDIVTHGISTFVRPLVFRVTETFGRVREEQVKLMGERSVANLKEDEPACESVVFKMLRDRLPVSNTVTVIGNVFRNPEYSAPEGVCTYGLAVNRSFHIMEDPEDIRSDFPWVKSFGENAERDNLYLKDRLPDRQGTTVYVRGSLQSRENYTRKIECPFCGKTGEHEDKEGTIEIISKETVFLRNYNDVPEKYESQTDTGIGNRMLVNGQIMEVKHSPDGSQITVALKVVRRRHAVPGVSFTLTINDRLNVLVYGERNVEKAKSLDLSVGNLMEVTGELAVYGGIGKKIPCRNCGNHLTIEASSVFVIADWFRVTTTPETIERDTDDTESPVSRSEGQNLLNIWSEFSDRIKVFGIVNDEPEKERYPRACRFPILEKRITYDSKGNARIKTDEITVRSYGRIATSNFEHLLRDSYVYIDGFVRSKRIRQYELECGECGCVNRIAVANGEMEILPYNTEYLKGCVFTDETEDVSDSLDDTQMEIDLYDEEEERRRQEAEAEESGYTGYGSGEPDDADGDTGYNPGRDDESGAGWDDDGGERSGSDDDYSDSWEED